MITPEEFPYIKSLYVNDCYAYKDFNVELHDYKPFSHLILTGKNGSGKSTILKAIHDEIFYMDGPRSRLVMSVPVRNAGGVIVHQSTFEGEGIHRVRLSLSIPHSITNNDGDFLPMEANEILRQYNDKVYSYFDAKRILPAQKVEGPSKETDLYSLLNDKESTKTVLVNFKQYLVNKKIDQAFSQLSKDDGQVTATNDFFETLRIRLSSIAGIEIESIEFNHKQYEFYLLLKDSQRLTFENLPDGFSSLLGLLIDLMIRVDVVRKNVRDYSYNPCGIVLIDEPETHLHLQLQEQVLPLLTNLFPNIQFIVATHSPAVVASIKQTTIFDLTTKKSRTSEDTVGRSYSDLMTTHFGLNNEYSTAADEIIKQVNDVLNSPDKGLDDKKQALQTIYDSNSAYLSPTLKVELEMLIVQHDVQQELK